MKRILIGLVAGVLLTLAGGIGIGLSGAFNVAATVQDAPPLKWFLHETFEASVDKRASAITPPAGWSAPDRIARGARSFAAMCAGCHTPPGMTDTPRAVGLNPKPPALVDLADHSPPANTFWVIKNGVRMTGMPAFGPTHDDDTLWDLAAFVQNAGSLSAEDYRAISAGPVDDGHAHRHGDEAGDGHADGHHDGHGHGDGSPVADAGANAADADARPENVVDAFHGALRRGDEQAVIRLLLPEVQIFESGRVEASRAEYQSHHLQSDLKAAAAITHHVVDRSVETRGDMALVMSRTHVTGQYRNQDVNQAGTETMVLRRTPDGWRVRHIHWSFGAPPQPAPAGHDGHDHEH